MWLCVHVLGLIATESKDRRKRWKQWLQDTYEDNEECPDYVCNPIQASLMWAWLTAKDGFVSSAVQGIAIAMVCFLFVLIF